MIENLYLVLDSGICIFAYNATEQLKLDENLVSGFMSAIMQFSKETFQDSTLEKVNISNRKKIVVYNPSKEPSLAEMAIFSKLRMYAVVDYYDHERLIQHLIKEMCRRFKERYKDTIATKSINETSAFDGFVDDVRAVLAGKTYPRTLARSRLGLLVSFLIIIIPVLAVILFGPDFRAIEISGLPLDRVVNFLVLVGGVTAVIIFTSGLVGGYIAGSRKNAVKTGIRLTILAFILIVLASFRQGTTFFGIAAVLLVYLGLISIIGSYFGGYLRDLQFLYPLGSTGT
nr:hypothetical protein [Candidatus Sigynarchaeota archaeon]